MDVLAYVVTLGVGVWLLVRTWNRKYRGTKWAINLGRVSCPRCSNPLPIVRVPSAGQQLKWGGWTCETCGCEVDKHGKEVAKHPGGT